MNTTMKTRLVNSFSIEKIIQRFLAAWCCFNFVLMLATPEKFTNISYGFATSIPLYAFAVIMLFVALTAVDIGFPKSGIDSWAFTLSYAVFSSYLLTVKSDIWFCLSMLAVTAVAICFILKDDKLGLSNIKLGNKLTLAIVAACGLLIFALITALTCLRYATYSSPNFDFGVFCNMFYYMRKGFLPLVSSERDAVISHFAVHISPIYYLLLPLYCVFPSPYTLQVGQALVLAGGIIPLYLLARHSGLSNKFIALLSVAYAFSPVIICGTSYDLHENCFLVPLMLWVFYFFEKEKYAFMYIACLLVCFVKEDAPLFILFFGVYVFLSRKKYLHGVILAAASAVYFGGAIFLLTYFGEGVLSERFMNYMYEDNGLIGMLRIIIMNPGYVFTQTLNSDKLIYLLQILLPLGFLPLASRKVSQLTLLLPFMLENLMTSYIYQYSIDFQYTYGAIACMLYLAVINAKKINVNAKRFMFSFAAVASAFIFIITAGARLDALSTRYESGAEEFKAIGAALDTLPEGASVKASTFFIPHIYERDEIYEIRSKNETDYVVFDMRSPLVNETADLRAQYLAEGYEVFCSMENYVLILQNPALGAVEATP